jgi:hypothetical protein
MKDREKLQAAKIKGPGGLRWNDFPGSLSRNVSSRTTGKNFHLAQGAASALSATIMLRVRPSGYTLQGLACGMGGGQNPPPDGILFAEPHNKSI